MHKMTDRNLVCVLVSEFIVVHHVQVEISVFLLFMMDVKHMVKFLSKPGLEDSKIQL